jgi:hypothetical protein
LGTWGACKAEAPPEKYEVEPPPTSADTIPESPLSGKIAGADFKIGNARYYVDRRLGYEKVDIKLSAGTSEDPCGQINPRESTMVWVRHTGPEPMQKLQATIDPKQPGPWEAHYQVHVEKNWAGNGTASALVVINDVSPDMSLHGELKVCFADKDKSCVAGTFVATYCPIRIDSPVRGTDAMERPPAGDAGWMWQGDGGEEDAALDGGEAADAASAHAKDGGAKH